MPDKIYSTPIIISQICSFSIIFFWKTQGRTNFVKSHKNCFFVSVICDTEKPVGTVRTFCGKTPILPPVEPGFSRKLTAKIYLSLYIQTLQMVQYPQYIKRNESSWHYLQN